MHRFNTVVRRVMVGATALAMVASVSAMSAAPSHVHASAMVPADAWLKRLNGKHRQLFDSPSSSGGIALIHILNFYDTYNKAYRVPDTDINAIGTFYGMTTFMGVNDAMWAKYRIGEFLGEKDANGVPATKNPWREAPTILGMELRQASIEALQKRGATFILCNNSLGILSGMLAKARGLDADAVLADMKANILPDVELIPGMVVAIDQAHAAGVSYHRQ
jgi:hypothetical protein